MLRSPVAVFCCIYTIPALVDTSNPSMDIHRAHNHPSINSAVPGTRIEISIHDASCSQSVRVEISVAERAEIGQPEVADILDAFPTVHITVVSQTARNSSSNCKKCWNRFGNFSQFRFEIQLFFFVIAEFNRIIIDPLSCLIELQCASERRKLEGYKISIKRDDLSNILLFVEISNIDENNFRDR